MPSALSKNLHPNPTRAKPGRPPVLSEQERRKRILDAAERIFTSDGYGAATMEGIICAAGMSKKTVYGLFPDKERLFAALIGDADAFPGGKKAETDPSDAVGELRDHLLALAEFVLSPRQVAMTRLVIAESRHSPKLADEFYARVMRKGQSHLTEGVARVLKARGMAEVDDIESTAMALFGAALGGLHLAALFGKQERFPRNLLIAQIDLAIGLLLPDLLPSPNSHSRAERREEPAEKNRAGSAGNGN